MKPFASLTASPSIQGSASPRSPRQHPDRLRTARTASVGRSSPGSIVLAGGSRPLVHRIKEAWPILRCRPTPVGSRSAASSVATGTFGLSTCKARSAKSRRLSRSTSIPVWSADGRQIFYQSSNSNIYSRSVTDGTPEQALLQRANDGLPVGRVAGRKRSSLHPGHGCDRSTSGMCRSVPTARLTHSFRRPSRNATASFLPTASGSRINRMTRVISKFTCSRFPAPVIGFRSLRAAASRCAGQETGRNCSILLPISD